MSRKGPTVADDQFRFSLQIEGTVADVLAGLAEMTCRRLGQQATPAPAGLGPDSPWMELPAEVTDPSYVRMVRYTGLADWVTVVPGIEVHVSPNQYESGANLEFRFHPAGPVDGG
jgi:hypothetical protein